MDKKPKPIRERSANLIDTSWRHSWHWPEKDWHPIALEEAKERRTQLINKLAELESLIQELEEYT